VSIPQTGINAYVRREWLNPDASLHTSYVMVHVGDSQGGTNKHGANVVWLADCRRVIQLEFFLGNEEAREESLAKINLLLEVLVQFGHALLNEANLIEKVDKEIKNGNPAGLSLVSKTSFSEEQARSKKRRRKPKLLAAKLKAIREKLNMSQSQLVAALAVPKISSARLSEFEHCNREPDLLVLRRYAELANVTIESLIDDDDHSLLDIQSSAGN